MGAKLTVKDHGWSKLMRAARQLSQAPVLKAGMLEQSNQRHDVVHVGRRRVFAVTVEKDSGLTNAELALILHFGTRDGDIPARPFLSNAVHENGKAWNKRLVEIANAVLKGEDPAQALAAFGPKVVADIKRAMRNIGIPDAQATLEEKTSSTPLVDSKQLINAVSFEVE